MESLYGLGTTVTIISDFLRVISFFLDGIVYSLIPVVYDVIYSLYDMSKVFGNGGSLTDLVNTMSNTIYSFLAIFMFFRVAFSLITMLVDPSVIDDKERGAKKIVTNIIVCLLLIVIVPWVFRQAKTIQARIIDQHIIEKVVTGKDFSDNYNFGNEFALSVWSVFLNVADSSDDAASAYNAVFNSQSTDWPLAELASQLINTTADSIFENRYKDASYALSYVYILSTIVGVYVLWTFITMMIDVAYRSIKFFALELLSPIAIVSYIDPASGKKGVFSKWLNETIKTYVSLFIRIFIFAFASVLLREFSLSEISKGNGVVVSIIYMLAIGAFIKMAPKFIDNLFGTSISKDSDTKFASNILKGVMGGAVAGTAGLISGAAVARKVGVNPLKGAFKGGYESAKKGYGAAKKGSIPGVVSATYGSYGDAKKKYGYNVDSEEERLINSLEKKVPGIETAKSAAVADLMANDAAKYRAILDAGAKVNGRKYGKGLEDDDGLENLLKKNAGGLAKDEVLHKGDAEYLERRRFVAKQKEAEAILSRTNALASSDYSAARSSYDNSSDKQAYFISFGTETGKMKYEGMDDKELRESFTSELQQHANNRLQTQVTAFTAADRNIKVDMVAAVTGVSRDVVMKMDDTQLFNEYVASASSSIKADVTSEFNRFNNASSHEAKIQIAVDRLSGNLSDSVSNVSESTLDSMFEDLNGERIVAKYGNSLTNIVDDAAKASGDAKTAQTNLDNYLKGKGQKAKKIDSAYGTAESRHKAKEYAQKQKNNTQ